MKNYALLFFLFLTYSAFSQQPIYQSFDVDSIAYPQGGSKALADFLQVNMRKPMTVVAQGIIGRVSVSGIVEPNGRISDVKLLGSLCPDCDPEALRVFRLFNAWIPAVKDGKLVRQRVSYSVLFEKERPLFYRNGVKTGYLDMDWLPVDDSLSTSARYKVSGRVSNNWLPTGDLFHYQRTSSGSWKQTKHYKFVQEELPQRTKKGRRIFRVGTKSPDGRWFDRQFTVDEDSVLLSLKQFDREGAEQEAVTYAENGAQIEKVWHGPMLTNHGFTPCINIDRWDANGQIREHKIRFPSDAPEKVFSVWDRNGRQVVFKGKGQVVNVDTVQSYVDTSRRTQYVETGAYENAFRQGRWTGRYADGSYFYEEEYDKGICKWGKSQKAGHDTLRYTLVERQPEFSSGKSGMLRFIKKNLNYPAESVKSHNQGEVVVGFIVNPDGTLTDYELVEYVDPAIDQEAVRLVKAMSGQWQPAIRRGEAVSSKVNLPIRFSLP